MKNGNNQETTLGKMNEEERATYDKALARLNGIMQAEGVSRFDIAQRSGIPSPTLNPWMDGTTKGSYPNTTRKVEAWLQTLADAEEVKSVELDDIKRPGFIETIASRKIFTALTYAQSASVMVAGTFGSGMGKTMTAKDFAKTRANVVYHVLTPITYAPQALQRDIAAMAKIERQRGKALMQTIGEALSEGGKKSLIIIDEAQYLKEKSINVLRAWCDVWGIGIAFLGNEDIFRALSLTASKDGAGQIQSRIRKRIHEPRPIEADINTYILAWGIKDPKMHEFLAAVGKKTGSLRHISETLESALMAASGLNSQLTLELLRNAWLDRTTETI